MVLTLYGGPLTTCSKRVALILHEKKVPFKFVEVDLRTGEHKSPAFLEKQPFGQVPVIVRPNSAVYLRSWFPHILIRDCTGR